MNEKDASGLVARGCNPLCKACSHRHLSYNESLSRKAGWVSETLSSWASVIVPIQSAVENFRYHYRRKVCLAAVFKEGDWLIGTMNRDEVVPIHDCPVQSESVNGMISLLRSSLPEPDKVPLAFFAQSGRIVTLVLKTKVMPDVTWIDEAFISRMQTIGVEGLWFHLHPSAGHRVFLKHQWNLVHGNPGSIDSNGLAHGPVSFQQQLPGLHSASLELAERFLQPSNGSLVIDLYSGTGSSAQRWHRSGAKVVGVELSGEAVRYAVQNVPEALFLRGKCSERIPQLQEWTEEQDHMTLRLLYVNPPRTGVEEKVVQWIVERYKPARIAYLSCSAGTLSKDLALLEKGNYRVVSVVPFDFFPFTHHVECLALLEAQ